MSDRYNSGHSSEPLLIAYAGDYRHDAYAGAAATDGPMNLEVHARVSRAALCGLEGVGMDGQRFDDLTRLLAHGISRRRVFKGLAGGLGGGLAALLGRASDDALASCGNVVCAGLSGVCAAGCDCCVFSNGNSRCMTATQCRQLRGTVEFTCAAGLMACGDSCLNGQADLDNCGACGNACPTSTDPCQVAVCTNGQCGFTAGNDGAVCDDGNACTQTDTCQAGVCVGGNPVVCAALDQCHDVGVCDPATGTCSNPNKVDGTSCNDDNACTTGDTCQGGVCTGGAPLTCTTDNPCLNPSCDPTSGCVTTPKSAGSACADSDLCNGNETCDGAGNCVAGTPVSCGPCQVCSGGACVADASQNGQTCSGGGNKCFGSFVCDDGACSGLQPVQCVAQDVCHVAGVCDPATGQCSNPDADNGSSCPAPANATGQCIDGNCQVSCNAGFADCNGNASDGCETDIASDPRNCGGCNAVCSNNNLATWTCTAGACSGACLYGFGDCNNDLRTDGCETNIGWDISADPDNCGACGSACSDNHVAVRECDIGGVCKGVCETGWGDCNGDMRTDGCETDLTTNANCGACGAACTAGPNVTSAACVGGVCNLTCAIGYLNCDGDVSTGCESRSAFDADNCGGCGMPCSGNHVAERLCLSGVCRSTCAAGYADCNNDLRTDGCETNLNTDANHCGACNNPCATGEVCLSGTCGTPLAIGASCAADTDCQSGLCCGSVCADPTTTANCGVCGNSCAADQICCGGACVAPCESGQTCCDGACFNLKADVNHCGACNTSCGTGQVCLTGTCVTPAGLGATCHANAECQSGRCCGRRCVDTNRSVFNCGACGHGCGFPQVCCGGRCVNTDTDVNNCGHCGGVCPFLHGAGICAGGGCEYTSCDAGYTLCADEFKCADLQTDPHDCGSCGHACASGESCVNGACVCQATACCPSGDTYCPENLVAPAGCYDTQTDPHNCGGCAAEFPGGSMCGLVDANSACCAGACTNIFSDPNNCGGCGIACNAPIHTGRCNAGHCETAACPDGFANCDGNAANGCEVNLLTDPNNCGACGYVCPCQGEGGRCINGSCCLLANATCGACGLPCCGGGNCFSQGGGLLITC